MRLDCPLRRCLSKIVSFLAAASLVCCMVPAAAFAGESATAAERATNDVVIQEAIDGLDNLEAGEDYTTGEVLVTYSGQDQPQSVGLSDGQSVADALEDVKDDDMVTAAQPNYIYQLMDTVPDSAADEGTATANDKLLAGQYYLGDESVIGGETVHGANVSAAWKLAKSNNSTTVAVLDTGAQLSHEDLQDNIDRAHMATVTSDGRVKVGSMKDEDGHGTHVAGILSATANNAIGITGASYNATVLPIRVFENHTSTTLQCIAGITYLDGLIESGQLTNLHVMNMSLGSYEHNTMDDMLHKCITHMYKQHGIVSVCAGGNGINGVAQTRKCVPADWSECVSVTSLTAYGTNSTWSDFNRYKDISAPGEAVLSTYSDEYAKDARDMGDEDLYVYKRNASYGFMEGTSMAAPLVSGVLALMWATYPDLKPVDAVKAIKKTARKVGSTYDDELKSILSGGVSSGSAGAINAAAALAYVQKLATSAGVQPIADPQPQGIISTKPAKVKSLKLKAKSTSISLSWAALDGVGGYQVRYRQKGKSAWKTKLVNDSLIDESKVKGLKRGKSYTVQVRAWRLKQSGAKIYGSWSSAKAVKTK